MTESNSSSYVLHAVNIPAKDYQLDDRHTLRPVHYNEIILRRVWHDYIPPGSKYDFMALPYHDESSLEVYRDLVIFHSFISADHNTYYYAEKTSNPLFKDSDIFKSQKEWRRFISNQYDFDNFPVIEKHLNPNLIQTICYRNAFETFRNLKTSNSNPHLYNLISLFAFAQNVEYINTIYTNSYLKTSFFITILEALIGRPESCSNIIELCVQCSRKEIQHDSISRTKHFENYYGKDFKSSFIDRHKTYHEGEYFDFLDSWFNLPEGESEKRERLGAWEDKADILEILTREKLVALFLKEQNEAVKQL